MTREATKAAAQVMLAWAEGKKAGKILQVRDRGGDREWIDYTVDESPHFDWYRSEYRIKPEPREFWAHERKE